MPTFFLVVILCQSASEKTSAKLDVLPLEATWLLSLLKRYRVNHNIKKIFGTRGFQPVMLPVKRAEGHGTLTKGVRGFWPNFEPENDIMSASSEMYINKLTCSSPHSEYQSLNVTVQISVCTLDWKQIQLMTSRDIHCLPKNTNVRVW